MLRTLTRALRRILLALGVAVLLLWVGSYVRGVAVMLPVPGGNVQVTVSRGTSLLHLLQGDTVAEYPFATGTFIPRPGYPLIPGWRHLTVPDQPAIDHTLVFLPLWLLAVLCLAWPVTSFIVARRRRGARGFEVTPSSASGSAAPKGQP